MQPAPSPQNNAYDSATFYDCVGSETLVYENPEEAIEYYIDWRHDPDLTIIELIKKLSPVEVTAHIRNHVGPAHIESWAEALVDRLEDIVMETEDIMGPDQVFDDLCVTDACKSRAVSLMKTAVAEFASEIEVWCCTPVATRSYSAEEVETMMRKHNPSWFTNGSS